MSSLFFNLLDVYRHHDVIAGGRRPTCDACNEVVVMTSARGHQCALQETARRVGVVCQRCFDEGTAAACCDTPKAVSTIENLEVYVAKHDYYLPMGLMSQYFSHQGFNDDDCLYQMILHAGDARLVTYTLDIDGGRSIAKLIAGFIESGRLEETKEIMQAMIRARISILHHCPNPRKYNDFKQGFAMLVNNVLLMVHHHATQEVYDQFFNELKPHFEEAQEGVIQYLIMVKNREYRPQN